VSGSEGRRGMVSVDVLWLGRSMEGAEEEEEEEEEEGAGSESWDERRDIGKSEFGVYESRETTMRGEKYTGSWLIQAMSAERSPTSAS
jgi:hypothetical protein